MLAARATEEIRRPFKSAKDFQLPTRQPRGITGVGGEIIAVRETEERRRLLAR